jgi:hypothetical protein
MFIDINKYVTNTNITSDKILTNQCDINLIEIYFINKINIREIGRVKSNNDNIQDNVIDVSIKNKLESFIDNYYKKSRVEKYKSYNHKERIYTYELSNDNQYVSSKIKKKLDKLEDILVICSKNDKQPNYTFPCTNEIDNVSEYILKEYKISNRISLIMRSDISNSMGEGADIKTLYIEYRHSDNVDTDKTNETINKIIAKILSQS